MILDSMSPGRLRKIAAFDPWFPSSFVDPLFFDS